MVISKKNKSQIPVKPRKMAGDEQTVVKHKIVNCPASIDEFRGRSKEHQGPVDVERFIRGVESYFQTRGLLDPPEKLAEAKQFLDPYPGGDLDVYIGTSDYNDRVKTWEDLRRDLRTLYSPVQTENPVQATGKIFYEYRTSAPNKYDIYKKSYLWTNELRTL